MKKFQKPAWLLVIVLASVIITPTFAQIEEIGNLVAGGTMDAKTLLQPYITPAINGFGAALSGGWYNTAEPHKLGGFDITFTGNVAFIPSSDKTFTIDNNALNVLKLGPSESNVSQSVSGDNENGPMLVYNVKDGDGNVVYSVDAFRMPQGLNVGVVPGPMIQAGVGLIKGTDVMFRYFPDIQMKGNEIGLWGIGGRHDIKQWIPGVKRIPVFKMSVMYGYTKLHTFVSMNIDPGTVNAESLEVRGENNWEDQYMKLWVKSHTANLLLAADLKVVTFYGGIGWVTTKTNLKFEGNFPIITVPEGEFQPVVISTPNPLSMEIKNQDGSITKPRFNAGIRFKLAVVTIHFDYSWANYSVLTGGLGISFR
ncbi:MAG TPA: DUF6588 family protein [Bacteroidales bacterium]|nr:DUF6588 family protein [Bacteroidales bacterium]